MSDAKKFNIDGTEIQLRDAVLKEALANGAGAHNAIYRGNYLGSSYTTAQKAQITAGAFEDLYVGDYWTIGGVNYRIAAFDYWYRCGDTECATHHVVLVPDSNFTAAKMNETNVTTGGYVGSDMYTGNNSNTGLSAAKAAINAAFGSANILNHREYLTNAVSTEGMASAGAWYDSTVDLMNEKMVYGCSVFEPAVHKGSIPTKYTINKSQLPLFRFRPDLICNRALWWLRDVVSSAYFAYVSSTGRADYVGASNSNGVRPAFAIC